MESYAKDHFTIVALLKMQTYVFVYSYVVTYWAVEIPLIQVMGFIMKHDID